MWAQPGLMSCSGKAANALMLGGSAGPSASIRGTWLCRRTSQPYAHTVTMQCPKSGEHPAFQKVLHTHKDLSAWILLRDWDKCFPAGGKAYYS